MKCLKGGYNIDMITIPEQLVIRPPSEAMSLLVKVVRGCSWNRCLFCGIYNLYGERYSLRSLEEVKKDIDALLEIHGDIFETAFLGDADPMALDTGFLVEVIRYLREKFPSLRRVTAYGRSSSLWKKGLGELKELHACGLDRIHVGMESGSNRILAFHKKGASKVQHIEAGLKVKEAGMEISFYFLTGLGGELWWQGHVRESADVVNAVKPQFLRIRRLWIHPASRLIPKIKSGEFVPQTPEGTVRELKDLIERLDAEGTEILSDHANNYIHVQGRLMKDKKDMLENINAFLELPDDAREKHYNSVLSVI